MRLDDLIGQSRAVTVLRNAIRRDRVAHSYLFWGPDGIGKSKAAILLAQALNCDDPSRAETGVGCGECHSCQLIARGNHPDVRVIALTATRKGLLRTEISIDQIRQDPAKPHETPRPLIQDASLKAALGRYKVYVIDPADRMSAEAGNALLRVLEDPPPHVVIVLVTSHPSVLLPTVVSRCQQVAFRLAGTDAIEQLLREMGLEPEAAGPLARLSGGRPGWAIRAAERPEVLATRKALLELCADFGRQPVSASLRMAEEVKLFAADLIASAEPEDDEEGADDETDSGKRGARTIVTDRGLRAELPWCLEVMASWYRDCLAAAEGAALVNADVEAMVRGGAKLFSCQQAQAAAEAILATRQRIERNANIDLALECLAIELSGVSDVRPSGVA